MPTTALSRVLLASPPAPVVPIPDPGDFAPLGLGPWAEAEAEEVSGLIIMMIITIIITNWRRCRCRHPFPDRSEGFLSPAAEARQVRLVLFYLFILFFVFNCNCNCGINCKVWIECCLLRVLGACLTVYLIIYLLLGVMVQYCTNLELINCWWIRGWLFFFFFFDCLESHSWSCVRIDFMYCENVCKWAIQLWFMNNRAKCLTTQRLKTSRDAILDIFRRRISITKARENVCILILLVNRISWLN